MKRIGTVKQTISGLANLFGDGVLNEELMELVDRKSSGRQPGFTKACRMILMEAGAAMNAREICDYFQQKLPALLARHKDPMASVTTVLNRLVDYGEAQAVVVKRQTRLALGCGTRPRTEPATAKAGLVGVTGLLRVRCGESDLSRRQQHAFFQMPRHVRVRRSVRIVRHHHNRLLEVFVQPLQNLQHFGRGMTVQVAGRLVGE